MAYVIQQAIDGTRAMSWMGEYQHDWHGVLGMLTILYSACGWVQFDWFIDGSKFTGRAFGASSEQGSATSVPTYESLYVPSAWHAATFEYRVRCCCVQVN